jgi:hypothetical protein
MAKPYEVELSDKKKIFYASMVDTLPDPVRSTRWHLLVSNEIFKAVGIQPTNGTDFGISPETAKEFSIHISDGAKIPDAAIKYESIWYMGYEKRYPVQQQNLAGDMPLNALLLEDGRGYEAMLAWNQCCLNSGILNKTGIGDTNSESNRIEDGTNKLYLGLGQQENYLNSTAVLLRNSHVTLVLYDWMYGNVIMGIRYINAWPSKVGVGTQMTYQNATLMKFNFTLTYDRWNIWFNPDYKVIKAGQA